MELMVLLSQMDYWTWAIIAVAFLILEVLAPGVIFMWLGIAAAITSVMKALIPGMSIEQQGLVFAALAVLNVAVIRQFVRRRQQPSDRPNLNRRGQQYVGRELTLKAPIENGRARVPIDDTSWPIAGPDSPVGTRVRVIGVEGAVLQVEVIDSTAAAPPASESA